MKETSKKINDYFKKWTVGQWVYVTLWLLAAIFLVVVIILFVAWQTSQLETIIKVIEGKEVKMLTDNALYQQNVIAAITFSFLVLLISAVFATTIESYLKKKRVGNK